MHQLVLGHVEELAIPSLGIDSLLAKVDTGAFSGALHCTDIALSPDKSKLWFNPMGNEKLRACVDEFEMKPVRSASGHTEHRFLIPVTVELHGKSYATTIGLTDRSDMVREMLLGRRFLREHNMVVDVTMSDEHDDEWKRVNL
jgi:hypothetical protein